MTTPVLATSDALDSNGEVFVSSAERTRGRAIGISMLALAALAFLVFGLNSDGSARFGLTVGQASNLSVGVPAATVGYLVGLGLAFAGGYQLSKGFGKRLNLVLAVAVALFVFAFLAWAASGTSFSLAGMLQESAKRSTPILFGALSGVLAERAGVVNIGIEGMLLGGAFSGSLFGSIYGVAGGLIAAILTGLLLSLFLAVMSIKFQVDQIITGVVINLFVLGLTNFLSAELLVENPDLNNAPILGPIRIPLLAEIPIVGSMLFNQNIFVYSALAIVAVSTWGLFHTKWGLRTRAVGEHPKAADTLGINVYATRYRAVMFSGLVAGLGGAYFTLGSVGRFDENMTAGLGFIGLAAMIFGRWHPVGALGAAFVFGFADSMKIKLGSLGTPIPSEFLGMAPYLVTIVVVAGLVGRSRAPAADGIPYTKS